MASLDISLDSSVLAGRMRSFSRQDYARRPTPRVAPRGISDVYVAPKVSVKPVSAVEQAAHKPAHPKPVTPPTVRKPQPSTVLARQFTPKPELTPRRNRFNASFALTISAALLLFMGTGVAYMGWRTNRKVVAQVQSVTQKAAEHTDGDTPPEEKKPDAGAYGSYAVAPDLPRYVRIPKLGVNAMVKRQSVDKKGALQAPGNVHVAGWYDGSSKPGEGGAVLLDGHVAGPTQHGVFYGLKTLGAGDKIEVERGDGKVFTYKVVKAESKKADQVDMAAALLPVVDGKGGLNLITCTGKVTGWHYDERLVVYAVQI